MKKEVGYRIEELIVLSIILLNILDFLEILPGELDYVKKIISWTVLGFLLYKASLSKIFYGNKNKFVDITLLFAYFCLVLKNIIYFANAGIEEGGFVSSLYAQLINVGWLINHYSFYIGGSLLIIIAYYMAAKLTVKTPSLMHVIHEEGVPKSDFKKLERFIVTYLVIVFFFVVVFNLVMEWLAFAVDASLLMVGLMFYILTAFRRHSKGFNPSSFIYKVGEFGESFYESFIGLFQSPKKIFLGISGMLILHLLTDFGSFILPYITGIHDILYFSQLGIEITSVTKMILYEFSLLSYHNLPLVLDILSKFMIIFIYCFSVLGMIFILVLPGYIWYKLYHGGWFRLHRLDLSIYFMAVTAYILSPAFKVLPIMLSSGGSIGLVGVKLILIPFSESSMFARIVEPFILQLLFTVLAIIVVGVFVNWISRNFDSKEKVIIVGLILLNLFFGRYIFLFFIDIVFYYSEILRVLVSNGSYFTAFYILLFFIVNVLFYIFGFIIFIFETRQEFKHIR